MWWTHGCIWRRHYDADRNRVVARADGITFGAIGDTGS
jgi:hypothetical protein